MADLLKEIETNQGKMGRPIPGQSLSNDPENPAPYERAPKFTSVHAASEYMWEKFIDPKVYVSLMGSISEGVPLADLAQIILFKEFQEGAWNPDLMMMLFEPTVYMMIALAERLDIPMTIYEGDLEDDDEQEMILGTVMAEQRIQDLIKRGSSGRIPEGTLNAEMQKSLENLPEIDVQNSAENQMAPVAEKAMPQPQSLMAPPVTAGV